MEIFSLRFHSIKWWHEALKVFHWYFTIVQSQWNHWIMTNENSVTQVFMAFSCIIFMFYRILMEISHGKLPVVISPFGSFPLVPWNNVSSLNDAIILFVQSPFIELVQWSLCRKMILNNVTNPSTIELILSPW